MTLLVSRLKVKDFAGWKANFESYRSHQVAAGLTNPRIYRSVDDGNDVTLLFDVADIAKAKAFFASPDLHAQMTAAGVLGRPDVQYLNPA